VGAVRPRDAQQQDALPAADRRLQPGRAVALAEQARDAGARLAARREHAREIPDRLQKFNRGPQTGKMRRLISVHQDNPAYFDIERWDWTLLGQHYLQRTSRR
jgi:hypothetical protein